MGSMKNFKKLLEDEEKMFRIELIIDILAVSWLIVTVILACALGYYLAVQ